jgi:ABC-type polysaccharide/polyol phosphate transport system ATPase subunit
MSAIVVEGVSKKFRLHTDRAHSLKELVTRRDRNAGIDQFYALDNVSLEIPEGSMYALVGHNGSGKSTLLRCIAGIYRPTEGSVKVQGRISTLLELGAGFHPDLTGRENVYMNATILGMSKKQIDAVFDEVVEFAGIQDFIDSPVKIYSSGMYVRLGFSVAIHVDPEILIIDEVIAVGDEEFQRKCFDHLASLRRKGVTVVVVTHGMGTVETMCDGAAWLDHGVLQQEGSAADIASAYVRQVNERERQGRQAAAIEAASAAVSDAEAGASDGASRLDEHVPDGEEWFGEDIEITEVFFTASGGRRIETATTGEPMSVNIAYRAHRPVEEPVFGYMIHTENDTPVSGTNTRIAGVLTGTVTGAGVVRLNMLELPLLPGNYDFTIGINDKFVQHTYDRKYRSTVLTVRRGDHPLGVGFTEIKGKWEILDGNGELQPEPEVEP